ncbi:MAG: regulatory iron-sulfur-containing complex subunit RicT [Candidatus Cloacimonadales bacterium]
MTKYIEIEFRSGKIAYIKVDKELALRPDDSIIIEVERGIDLCNILSTSVPEEQVDKLKSDYKEYKYIRMTEDRDFDSLEIIKTKEEKANATFLEIIPKYEFEMKLISTVYQFDGNKLTFNFTADGRIDFRLFVRELANIFKTRIELHQTTGRDEAKLLGGFGMCGKVYCCSSFMRKFNQVTIKMAKDQNLAGNLSKISGPCGRLLCCLQFEEDYYEEIAKDFPVIGTKAIIDKQMWYVFKNDYYNKKVYLSAEDQAMEIIDLETFKNEAKIKYVPDDDDLSSIPGSY